MKIGILGGGHVGSKLASLLQASGHRVVVGVRSLPETPSDTGYGVGLLADVAADADMVIIALPFDAIAVALAPLRTALTGKIVVDASNPVNADWSPMLLGQENSAGEEVQGLLPESRVVKAFNTVFADVMTPTRQQRNGHRVTVFIASDDEAAASSVAALAREMGFAPALVGPLHLARHLEAMAHLNIAVALSGGGTNAAFIFDQVKG